ncbi:fused MFS/spermidine synthase [Hyalangium rubrum]|uniref:Polyamine aminopropyltransferase n=1 Tax=Hyalangium rubrum TaxID=3103134 RepID=A0ABU5HAR7_9BACT|nr:fused MFS/spermidine synthase [Hyalangium sp. s54d21]MDY7230568.1 fused MFS/spermidine synthase [Hyalangium sp. s54d21]
MSGATALVYELVWSKYLANVLGNSGQAHAVVLATFMGGLALGAYVFGRTADRVKNPLRMYGLLELGVGLYVFLFPSVLEFLSAAYLAVAVNMPEGVRVVPKLVLAALSLVVPTMLMGGTLPALVRHFSSKLSHVQRELARLYAINSLGAAMGVFLAGTTLVPAMGLAVSSRIAAALNILLALVAIVVARRYPPAQSAEAAASQEASSEEGDNVSYPRLAVRAALVGVMLSGFTSMLYQVTWIRLLTIVLGASTYAFTLILTAFILGIGLGSFWLMTRKGKGDLLRLFGHLQVGLVLSVCVALPLYVRLPNLFSNAQWLMNHTADAWSLYQIITFGFCCVVLLVPTFFMGAAFPAAARVATAKVEEVGRELGGVYLWNTVGTILGSALGGLVLMPWWGMEGNFIAGVVGNLLAAGAAFYASPQRPAKPLRAFGGLGVGLAAGVIFLVAMNGWAVTLSGIAQVRVPRHKPPAYQSQVDWFQRDVKAQFYQDDTFASVLVGQLNEHRFMRINGKIDASNGDDTETMVLAGHLGMLLHPREPENALVVGAGAAITTGSMLAHPVKHLDMVEISPAVIEAARLFKDDNRNAVDDPRTHVHVDDAKTFMALAPRKYDLIVSVPSNPWVAGVSGLFTRDFFQTVDKHLADDGVLVQWIHTYESSRDLIRLVVRTMRDTFPHATTWLGPSDIILVASRKPLSLDQQKVIARMARPDVKEDLARVDIHDLFTLLSKQIHSEEGQLEFAGPGPINTDDHNILEYSSPIAFFIGRQEVRVRDERRGADGGKRLWVHRYMEENPPTVEQLARLHRNLERFHAANDPLVRGAADRWHALAPDSPEAALALAKSALATSDLALSQSLLEPLINQGQREPKFVIPWLKLATARSWGARTVWTPNLGASAAAALGRQVAADHPQNAELAQALRGLCEALPASDCPDQKPASGPAVAAPMEP